jgi:hypothetical protein
VAIKARTVDSWYFLLGKFRKRQGSRCLWSISIATPGAGSSGSQLAHATALIVDLAPEPLGLVTLYCCSRACPFRSSPAARRPPCRTKKEPESFDRPSGVQYYFRHRPLVGSPRAIPLSCPWKRIYNNEGFCSCPNPPPTLLGMCSKGERELGRRPPGLNALLRATTMWHPIVFGGSKPSWSRT